jgi:hypothetical protein
MKQRTEIVSGRNCDGCTMCCKLLRVEELETPPLSWCPHCVAKSGCAIYVDRPTECRQFYCEYLLDASLGEHWKPSRCKMVVVLEDHVGDLVIHTDPDRPHVWPREPFRSDVSRWARTARRNGRQVIVWEGERKIVVTPDRLGPDETATPAFSR